MKQSHKRFNKSRPNDPSLHVAKSRIVGNTRNISSNDVTVKFDWEKLIAAILSVGIAIAIFVFGITIW